MGIDLVSYINLRERNDRRTHMENLLKKCRFPVTRVEGIRLNSNPESLGYRMRPEYSGSISIASIFISHQNALNEAKLSISNGHFVLLEDDCHFSASAFESVLKPSSLPHDWDIIMVSPRFRDIAEARTPRKRLNIWQRLNPLRKSRWKRPIKSSGYVRLSPLMSKYVISGAHFVVFRNVDVIDRILEKMNSLQEIYHVDYFYASEFLTFGIDAKNVMAGGFGSDNRS